MRLQKKNLTFQFDQKFCIDEQNIIFNIKQY